MWDAKSTAGFVLWILLPIPVAAAAVPSVEDTLAEFNAICERLRLGDNPFFGEAVVEDLRQGLVGSSVGSKEVQQTQTKLAIELIRLGRTQEAFELAEQIVPGTDPGLVSSRLLLFGILHLRLAEEKNCVDLHNVDSCILPIREQGVHAAPEHAQLAGNYYLRYLERQPDDSHVRWLLNLTRMLAGSFPAGVPEEYRLPDSALDPPAPFPRWFDIAADLAVNSLDHAGGAVMDDFDGDGLLDLISSSWHPCEPMRAFRNDGQGGFEDVTRAWGLDGQLGGLNLNHADYDNDGRLDLFVMRGAWMGGDGRIRNSLLRNDLDGPQARFVDVTSQAGIAYPAYPSQAAAWGDYDNDGDLDLYIGNESQVSSLMTAGSTRGEYPSQLFRNQGDGTFTDVARAVGVENRRYTKGVAWGDYDNDEHLDLYVSTFAENRLYRNGGDGTFTDVAPELGVTQPDDASFATWFFDFDNDGDLDIFAADYGTPIYDVTSSLFGPTGADGYPIIYRNEGARFRQVSLELGVDKPVLPMGANYGDLDNDGFPDFYLGTGVPDFDALVPNLMYLNVDGKRFEDVTYAGGFGHLQKGHGVAFGDLDNDGDQDLFHQVGGAYPFDSFTNALFENPGNDAAWIVLRLQGQTANRWGMGARIEVSVDQSGTSRTIYSQAGSGGSFGSSSLQQEIGLGRADRINSIAIRWPGGQSRQVFAGPIEANRFYLATENEPALQQLQVPKIKLVGEAPGASHVHHGEND